MQETDRVHSAQTPMGVKIKFAPLPDDRRVRGSRSRRSVSLEADCPLVYPCTMQSLFSHSCDTLVQVTNSKVARPRFHSHLKSHYFRMQLLLSFTLLILGALASCTVPAGPLVGPIPDENICKVNSDLPSDEDEYGRIYLDDTLNFTEAVKLLNGLCQKSIIFVPRDQGYVIKDRIVVHAPYRDDPDGDGFSLTIDTNEQNVTFDARSLPPDSCALELDISRIRIGPSQILHGSQVHPICDFGKKNDLSAVTIVAE